MGSVIPLFIPGAPKLGTGLSTLHHVNPSAVVFGLVCIAFPCVKSLFFLASGLFHLL